MAPKGDNIITVHEVNHMARGRQKRRYTADKSCDPQLLITAWHEAGHAIAYFGTGQRFKYVTIVPTDWALGHCAGVLAPPSIRRRDDTVITMELRDEFPYMYRTRTFLEQQVIVYLAGAEAEALYTGVNPLGPFSVDDDDVMGWVQWYTWWQTSKQSEPAVHPSDLELACTAVGRVTDSEEEAIAYLRHLQLRARRLVSRNRADIEALAVCLTVYGKLTYKRAHHLVYERCAQWNELRALRTMLAENDGMPNEQAG